MVTCLVLKTINADLSHIATYSTIRFMTCPKVSGQCVAVEWVKVHKYRRKMLLDGLNCNMVLANRGLEWHYKHY